MWIPPWHSRRRAAPPYNPYLNDVATQILPWAKEIRVAFKGGDAPLRKPVERLRHAARGNSVSARVSRSSPSSRFLLPLARGYTLTSALRALLAAAGMWLWTREIGASKRAAAFAATAFALCLNFAAAVADVPRSPAETALWPWVLFLVERLGRSARSRAIGALTSLFVATVLCGTSRDGRSSASSSPSSGSACAPGDRSTCLGRARRGGIAVAGAIASRPDRLPADPVALRDRRIRPARRGAAAVLGLACSRSPHAPAWRMLATPLFPQRARQRDRVAGAASRPTGRSRS
jgi:hypothetical protein